MNLPSFLFIAMLANVWSYTHGAAKHGLKYFAEDTQPSWFDPELPQPHTTHDLHPVESVKRRVRHRQLWMKKRRELSVPEEMAPLFPGYGTHYAYIYVGKPPQRQSVILDTGSRFTAFPCKGCKECGVHTDNYFDLQNSSTAVVLNCPGGKSTARKLATEPASAKDYCPVSQSYTEGSSWDGYKVSDVLYIGGIDSSSMPKAPAYSIKFTFACLQSETGLFQKQLADGIMGMSNSNESLPNQLVTNGITSSNLFALCFRVGGGILTLGGVDQRIHTKQHKVTYLKIDASKSFDMGWYHVLLQDIQLVSKNTKSTSDKTPKALAIGLGNSHYLSDKGTIIDSGTTDTYLPASIKAKFEEIFSTLTGLKYNADENIKLTSAQVASLPTINFIFETMDGKHSEIEMSVENYVDVVADENGMYAFRILFSEKEGNAVLGSNFMTNYNVIFDAEGGRIGMTKSSCNYEEFNRGFNPPPADNSDVDCATVGYLPWKVCSAVCNDPLNPAYLASGIQIYQHPCTKAVQYHNCTEQCSYTTVTSGLIPSCPTKPWSDCTHACIQSRQMLDGSSSTSKSGGKNAGDSDWAVGGVDNRRRLGGKGKAVVCDYHIRTTTCNTGDCPRRPGDYLVYIDMKVFQITPKVWSYVYTDYFLQAFSVMFKVSFTFS